MTDDTLRGDLLDLFLREDTHLGDELLSIQKAYEFRDQSKTHKAFFERLRKSGEIVISMMSDNSLVCGISHAGREKLSELSKLLQEIDSPTPKRPATWGTW